MVTYGDYFSRKTLYSCGVSPNAILLNNAETTYTGTKRTQNIRSDMSKIYQTLFRGYAENKGESKTDFKDLQVERKIVSAFYDSGVLSNAERDYFQTQALQGLDEREKICVEEANVSAETATSKKVDAPINIPTARNVRQ